MFKRVIQHSLFALVNLLLIFSCGDGNNANEEIIERTYSEEDILESKKNEIVVFYDNIGFEIIDLVLTDRVYETNPESKPQLKGLALDSFPNKLNKEKEGEHNVRLYVDTLIEYRNEVIKSDTYEAIVRNFGRVKDSLLESTFFNETIIYNKHDNERYIELIDYIDNEFVVVKNNLSATTPTFEIDRASLLTTASSNEENKSKKTFTSFFNDNGIWWFALLISSIFLNVFQFIFFRNKIKNIEAYPNKNKTQHLKENTKEYKRSSQEDFATSIPTTLQSKSVKEIIDEAYDQMQQLLSDKYHKDCLMLISDELDSFRLKGLNSLKSKSFNNRLEVEKSIKSIIDKHQSILERKVETCIPKTNAETKIQNTVKRENFNEVANIELLSEDEIDSIIQQMKKSALIDLSATMDTSQLVAKIDELEENIIKVLQKKIKDNLVYYFPFTDSNGTLDHEKKTKTIERDSAIKLSVNPEDISKATFTLLYEEDNMMQAGIMSYDSFLVPICELKSEDFNSTGTRIEQKGDDGTMELEDGYWRVKDKLPIKVI